MVFSRDAASAPVNLISVHVRCGAKLRVLVRRLNGCAVSVFTRNNVRLSGSGDRAMLFAHGFGTDQSLWHHIAPHFESEYTIVRFDHVGSGHSDKNAYSAERYASLEDYARDVVEIGRALGCENAVYVGHSCGAMIGALASVKAPNMFESLIMLSPSPRYINEERYLGGFSESQVAAMIRDVRRDFAHWSSAMAPVFMGNPDRPELARELLKTMGMMDPHVAAQFAEVIFTSDCRPALGHVQAQTLVVLSAHDAVVPAEVGKYLKRHLARCQLRTLRTDGHFPLLSAPEQVVEAIRRFNWINRAQEEKRQVPAKPAWVPSISKQELRILRGSWSERLAFAAEIPGREPREELLLQRVGELAANLGRFDMYALGIQQRLGQFLPEFKIPAGLTLRTRGAVIAEMLGRCNAGLALSRFSVINAELLVLILRHEIAARNSAQSTHLNTGPAEQGSGQRAAQRDWFDYQTASDTELALFTDALEREILTLASLRQRLVDVTGLLKELPSMK
jgi:sigma-B regulation protein RsbQ